MCELFVRHLRRSVRVAIGNTTKLKVISVVILNEDIIVPPCYNGATVR